MSPGLIRECGDAGVQGAVVLSAGFKEMGAAGVELEETGAREARKTGMRVIGPNCLGLMSPHTSDSTRRLRMTWRARETWRS